MEVVFNRCSWCALDLMDNAPVTVRHLAANASLTLRMPNSGRMNWTPGWPHAPATVYVHHPETGIVERPDLTISRTLTVLRREEQGTNPMCVWRQSLSVTDDGRWTFALYALKHRRERSCAGRSMRLN